MPKDFFDPPPEETEFILVDRRAILDMQRYILSCEACSDKADIPFNWILDRYMRRSGATTDYILETPATCLRCGSNIVEKTLVEPDVW